LADHKEIETNDWSLTPGRYVGVAPEGVDEDFDFEETLSKTSLAILRARDALIRDSEAQ